MDTKTPNRIVLEVNRMDGEAQQDFADFSKLCVLLEQRKEDAYRALIRAAIAQNFDLLSRNWVDWDGLEVEMRKAGFSINRTTLWSYRNKGLITADLIKSNGVNTLFDADGILAIFQST